MITRSASFHQRMLIEKLKALKKRSARTPVFHTAGRSRKL